MNKNSDLSPLTIIALILAAIAITACGILLSQRINQTQPNDSLAENLPTMHFGFLWTLDPVSLTTTPFSYGLIPVTSRPTRTQEVITSAPRTPTPTLTLTFPLPPASPSQ